MQFQVPQIILNIYKFYTFVSTCPLKMFFQILIWIVFSIPFLAISLTLILLEYVRFAISLICDLFTVTVVLIPIAFILNLVFLHILFPIVETVLYIITVVFTFPVAMLMDK